MAKEKTTKRASPGNRQKKEKDTEKWRDESSRLRAGKGSSYDGFGEESSDKGSSRSSTTRSTGAEKRDFEPDYHSTSAGENIPGSYSSNERIQSEKSRERSRSAHFERFAAEGNRFIREVACELGTDDHSLALRVTKAVLHAVRDRIPPDDAVQFAQGLPTMLKAIYFEEYDISRTPVVIRNADEFIDFIRYKNRFSAINDFRSPQDVVDCLRAVFRVLERTLDYGQVRQIKHLLHSGISDLIEVYNTGRR
jgi:uncharacterized protein (DUF2267 family)